MRDFWQLCTLLLWVIFVVSLVWVIVTVDYKRIARRVLLSAASLSLYFVRKIIHGFDIDQIFDSVLGPNVSTPPIEQLLEALQQSLQQQGKLKPGLISFNLPKTLSATGEREIEVRISQGRSSISEHRDALRGGPPAYTRDLRVGDRMKVTLVSPNGDLNVLTDGEPERDFTGDLRKHWLFTISCDPAVRTSWRTLTLVAQPIRPADDPFIVKQRISTPRSWFDKVLGRLHAFLPDSMKSFKVAFWSMIVSFIALLGVGDIAKPYIHTPLKAFIHAYFGEPPADPDRPAPTNPPAQAN
ncbi:MAG: hypothetical protein R3F54_19340 [Alphaproteobacteria bacterium]